MRNNKIKEIREKNKLTQKELSEKIGVSTRAIISLEKKNSLVNKYVKQISEITGASELELMGYDMPENLKTTLQDYHNLQTSSEERLRQTVAAYEARISNLNDKINQRDKTIAALEHTISSLEITVSMYQKRLDATEKD